MTKTNNKLIILVVMIFLALIIMRSTVYGKNENIEILKKSTGDYLIYIKDNLDTDFEFAFSNDENADKESLSYIIAETDSAEENTNRVAYINSATIGLFSSDTYMWARKGSVYIIDGVQIDLENALYEDDLTDAELITKDIEVDLTQTNTEKETVDGKEITTTVGKVVINNPKEGLDYAYILIKLPNSDKYNKLSDMATIISKFNSKTDMYTRINVYRDFLDLYSNLIPDESDKNWTNVQENEILQPKDAEDGDKYILWIKESENDDVQRIDIQFLTSSKKYSEETIIEKITTKLPVTYDNNTMLILLIMLIAMEILVRIRINALNKQKEK